MKFFPNFSDLPARPRGVPARRTERHQGQNRKPGAAARPRKRQSPPPPEQARAQRPGHVFFDGIPAVPQLQGNVERHPRRVAEGTQTARHTGHHRPQTAEAQHHHDHDEFGRRQRPEERGRRETCVDVAPRDGDGGRRGGHC